MESIRARRGAIVGMAAVGVLGLASADAGLAAEGDTLLVSRGAGDSRADVRGYAASISGDGRFVAFDDGRSVFVRDLQTDSLTLVSRATGPDGAQGEWDNFVPYTSAPSISTDGRFVAFVSNASNLHPDDTDQNTDVFVRDLATDTTTLISRASGADGANGNDHAYDPSVSGDGRFVAFTSTATNLAPGDVDTGRGLLRLDVFVRDTQTGETTLVSTGPGTFDWPSVSRDGRFVAYASDDAVFVRSLENGTTSLRAPAPGGTEAARPSISATGRFVAYELSTDRTSKVFVHDVETNRTVLASRRSRGVGAPGPSSSGTPSISDSGRYVAFESSASHLQPYFTGYLPDIYVRDVRAGTTTLVSRASGPLGLPGDGGSHLPEISGDGRFVAFETRSSKLHPYDRNRSGDVLVRDLGVPPPDPPPRRTCRGRRATIIVLPGSEPVLGSETGDTIFGSSAPDDVDAGPGKDTLCGRGGRDRLRGGGGNDLVHSADGSRDIVSCGGGRDRVIADRRDRVRRCERRR